MDLLLVLITRYLFFISFVFLMEAFVQLVKVIPVVVIVKHQERGILLAVEKAGLQFRIQEFQGD